MSLLESASADLPQSPVREGPMRLKWSITRDAFFTEKLVEYKRAGKKSGVSWRPEVWKELSQDFAEKFGVNATIMQLKARLQVIKLKYSQLKGCICQPGFTWDNERKMVEASDKDWDDYLKKEPKARAFRNVSVPLFDDWGFMFAGEAKTSQSSYRAGEDMLLLSGDSHVIKGDIEEAFSNEDTNGETSGCGHSKRHRCKSSKGRKIPRVDSKNHHDELIKEMANGIITASRPSSHVDYSNCLDIVMAMKELSAVEKIHAAEYLKDEKDALMFLKFDKECRLTWLKMKLGKSKTDDQVDDLECDQLGEVEENLIAHRRSLYNACLNVFESYIENQNKQGATSRQARSSVLSGKRFVQELIRSPITVFRGHCRMDQHAFSALCQHVKDSDMIKESVNVYIEEMVMTFVYIIGIGASNRSVQAQFQHSGETVSRRFNEVLHVCYSLAPQFISLPQPDIPEFIKSRCEFRFFKDCLGAIDSSYIPVEVPNSDKARYLNSEGYVSVNIMVACSFDLKFMYVNAGSEGSRPDFAVLTSAVHEDFYVPEGKYYLVDAGYANTHHFLAPYHGVRYHLNQFGQNHAPPRDHRELFNLRHSSLRNVIERMLGVLKKRFQIFQNPLQYPLSVQTKIITVSCMLHNLIRECLGGKDQLWLDIEREKGAEIDREVEHRRRERLKEQDENTQWQTVTAEQCWLGELLRERIAKEMWEDHVKYGRRLGVCSF